MLKKINVDHLQLGMHLQAFCGSWLDHPFWRTQFVLSDPKELALVKASAICEVWIDSSKGLDVAPAEVVEESETLPPPCALMIALARQLGLSDQDTHQAGMAGLLHDLGKALMPPAVLNKPGKLTDEEFAVMKTHPAEGHQLLREGNGVSDIMKDVCLHHHEKRDGSGYPDRLQGEQISFFARMGAVCDVYDAITSNRPYKAGWDPAESIKRMAGWQGHFDPPVFQAFVKRLGIYPIGSCVRLQSGRLGVVVEPTEKSLLQPRVKVFFSTKSKACIQPEIVDLSRPGALDKIASREDPAWWGIQDINRFWAGDAAKPA